MHRVALIIGLALVWVSFAPAAQADQSVTLGATPTLGGGIFTTGGGISVAVEAHQINGVPHLCGVWARSTYLSAYVTHKVAIFCPAGVCGRVMTYC